MVTKECFHYYTTEEYRKRLAEKLKMLRKSHPYKVTQEDVADFLHVERQHINRLENGKIDANIKELICYSKMFGCDIDFLLYGDEPEYQRYYGTYEYPYPELDSDDPMVYCHRPEL